MMPEQPGPVHLADRAARDAPLPVDHDGRGDGRRGQGLVEQQLAAAVGVDHAGVGHLEPVHEGGRGGLGVAGVQPDQLDAVGLHVGPDLLEIVGLGTAGGAPGRPHVEHDDLAEVVGQGELVAVEGGAREVRGRDALRLGDDRGGAVPGHIALLRDVAADRLARVHLLGAPRRQRHDQPEGDRARQAGAPGHQAPLAFDARAARSAAGSE